MLKEHLLTPGPTQIPLRVLQAMSQPQIHHRTKDFEKIFRATLDGFKWLVESDNDPVFLACTGTGAMEAALLNSCDPGDKVIVINAGKFGERWSKIAARLGLKTVEITAAAGESPTLEQIEKAVRANADAKALCVQYCETSTAVMHPVPTIGAALQKTAPDMLYIVDAVSALGTLSISMKKDHIDILVAGSQKGLMLPPGLAMLTLSERAWQRAEKVKSRSFYFDLLSERKAHRQDTTAWTPAISIILGLHESLQLFREEGLENVFARHRTVAKAVRSAMEALGLTLLGASFPSPGVTAAFVPAGMDADKLRSALLAASGVRIAGGQDELQGKIIRVGHMGYVDTTEIIGALGALELGLKLCGHVVTLGSGVAAALEVIGHKK